GEVTVGVKAAAGNSNTASLVGNSITASQGFAVINNAYVMQKSGTFGAGNNYQLTASSPGLMKAATSNAFQLNKAAFDPVMTPNPTITVTLPHNMDGIVKSGDQFEVDVQLQANGKPTSLLNGKANVSLELRNGDGSFLIAAPGTTAVPLAYNSNAKPDTTTGLIQYFVTLTSPKSAGFQLLGLLDLDAQVATVDIKDPVLGGSAPTV